MTRSRLFCLFFAVTVSLFFFINTAPTDHHRSSFTHPFSKFSPNPGRHSDRPSRPSRLNGSHHSFQRQSHSLQHHTFKHVQPYLLFNHSYAITKHALRYTLSTTFIAFLKARTLTPIATWQFSFHKRHIKNYTHIGIDLVQPTLNIQCTLFFINELFPERHQTYILNAMSNRETNYVFRFPSYNKMLYRFGKN